MSKTVTTSSPTTAATTRREKDDLPPCSICRVAQSAYCCPRCSTRTCSLKCCLQHKSQTGCNGKRNRTAFCSLARFTDSQLTSDYHFLEDVLKCGDRAGRFVREEMGGLGRGRGGRQGKSTVADQKEGQQDGREDVPVSPLLRLSMAGQSGVSASTSSSTTTEREDGEVASEGKSEDYSLVAASPAKRQKMDDGIINSRSHSAPSIGGKEKRVHKTNTAPKLRLDEPDWMKGQPPHLRRLVRAAADRNMTLLLMPAGMARRKENTTSYSPKQDVIRWRIKFHFHTPSSKVGVDIVTNTNPSPAVVTITVDGIPESTQLFDLLSAQLDVKPDGKNRAARSKLRALASMPRHTLRILTKELPRPASSPLYVELQPDQSLADALRGLTIVEYPVLEIVKKQDLDNFPRRIEEL